jgi:uncharacterized protein involved in exopolysaccharide biosynthesis
MRSVAGMLSPSKAFPVNSVLDLLRVLRQKILFIAVLFALVMSGIVAGVYLRKPAFESTAKVLISFEGLGISLSRAEYQIGNTQVQAVEAITSQGEILQSRNLVEQVIDEIGVEALRDPPPASMIVRIIGGFASSLGNAIEDALFRLGLATRMSERDSLVARLSKSLSVFPVRQSHILTVSVRWHRPEIARLLLSRVMQTYFAMNKKISQRANNYEVFAEQTRQLSAELSDAEQALLQFKLRNNLLDLPREKQILSSQIERLSALLEGMAAVAGYVTAPPEEPAVASGADNAAVSQVSSLQAQLVSFRVELARLRISSTPDNRAVRQLESQIAEVEKTIAGILAWAARSLDQSKARLRVVNEAEASYERIRRDVEMARDAYQTYRKVTEDRRAMQSRNMQINVQIIDSPSLPLRAAGPSRLTLLIAGLPFSLICAIGLMLLVAFYRSWIPGRNGSEPEADSPV